MPTLGIPVVNIADRAQHRSAAKPVLHEYLRHAQHSLRESAVASGLKAARPELSVCCYRAMATG